METILSKILGTLIFVVIVSVVLGSWATYKHPYKKRFTTKEHFVNSFVCCFCVAVFNMVIHIR